MLDQWLLDLLLQVVKVPLEMFIIIVILSGGIYLIIVILRRPPPPPTQPPRLDPDSAAMQELIIAMLEGRNDDFASIFSRHSIDPEKSKLFEALAAITLDVIFNEEHTRKSVDEKIDHLESKNVPRGHAKVLLVLAMRACSEVAARSKGATEHKESEWSHLL